MAGLGEPAELRRAGSTILAQLVRPAACLTVRALARRPMRLGELTAELQGPSRSTVRARLRDLVALGAVTKRGGGMPYAVWSEMTDVGRDLLRVVDVLDAWLARAPAGPIPLGGSAAKRTVKAFVVAWDSALLRALAATPQSLADLDGQIGKLSYPALERRLVALRAAGLVEPVASVRVRTYRISTWGREAAGPLLAAVDFERAHMAASTAPLEAGDLETVSRLGRDA